MQTHSSKDDIQIKVDEDKMKVKIIYRGPPILTIHEENIYALLREKNIKYGIKKEKIYEVLEKIKNKHEDIIKIEETIVEGKPPEPSRDGYYQLFIDPSPTIPILEDGKVDHKNIVFYKIVEPKTRILLLVPPYKGKKGINIYAEEVDSSNPEPVKIQTGENIELIQKEDQKVLGISKIYGVLELKENKIDIKPDLIIDEDASIEKGNIRFRNNIIIKKNVLRGLSIYGEKDLIVEQNLESGFIKISGNISVRGGINTNLQGTIICGKDLKADFIENTNIISKGNIIAGRYILNSNIVSFRNIILESSKSKIIGGKIVFYENLICASLGNPNFLTTEIYVGYSYHIEKTIQNLHEEYKNLHKELLKLLDELKSYQAKLKRKVAILQTDKKIIYYKLEQYNKLKQNLLKKEELIKTLKDQIFNKHKIIIHIPNETYPGVIFHYYNKKFPINDTLFNKKFIFDPLQKTMQY